MDVKTRMTKLRNSLALRDPRARGRASALAILVPSALLLASQLSWIDATAGLGAGVVAITLLLAALVEGINHSADKDTEREDELSVAVDQLRDSIAALHTSGTDGVVIRREIGEHPWTELFASATNVRIVAKFFDYAISGTRSDAVEDFLKGEGHVLRVVTVDPRCREARESMCRSVGVARGVKSRSFLPRSAESIETLEHIRNRAGAAETSVQIYPFAGILSWAAYSFDDRTLIFAPYELYLDESRRSPRLEIDLDAVPEFKRFWTGQWDALMNGHTTGSHIDPPLSAQDYVALHADPALDLTT